MVLLHSIFLLLGSSTCLAASSNGWTRLHRAPSHATITLHIGLKNEAGYANVERVAAAIADPNHALYRKHYSPASLQTLLTPASTTVEQVSQWLFNANISSSHITHHGNLIEVTTRIEQAEALLETTYHTYSNGLSEILRAQAFQIPGTVRQYVDFVSPTSIFPQPRSLSYHESTRHIAPRFEMHSKRQEADCGADDLTTPSCIRHIYNITYTPKPNRTTFAVYATEAASFNASDLQAFLQAYNAPAAYDGAQYQVLGNGDPANGKPGIEGAFETALDTQTVLGLAAPARGLLYNLGGVFGPIHGSMYDTYDPFVQFLKDLVHNQTVPSVVSFSESMAENTIDEGYARSVCTMLAAAGARGVTLIFSSGNNGAQGDQPDKFHAQVFEPKFPASCPFVTSVGGTTDLAAETAATQRTIQGAINKVSFTASGGGFSNYFDRPQYQNIVVEDYIHNHVSASYGNISGFNASGRGIPDVAAFSTSFPAVVNNATIPVGGTSAAAPVWAAIITLLNDYEASKGRPPLGFINPWLYSLPNGSLRDITTGGNNSGTCAPQSNCTLSQTPGYAVTVGWDAVTGLGSPLFNKFIDALDIHARSNNSNSTSSSTASDAPVTRQVFVLVVSALVLMGTIVASM